MTISSRAAIIGVCALLGCDLASANGGYATRDLNPMLQPIYLPTLATFNAANGWKIDHSVYLTNTMQSENRGDERLVIDVENYRYELGLRYRHDQWLARADIPFVANSSGEFDSSIESWHEFWGFSNGRRDDFPKNDINVSYRRDGRLEYHQDSSSSGIADIGLAVGYQASDSLAWFAGIEIPTGEASDFSGNEALDSALWLTYQDEFGEESGIFALFGVSFPGDGGELEGLVAERIWVAQLGFDFRLYASIVATIQMDIHSKTLDNSELKAFGNSLQMQFGLGFLNFPGEHRLDLFFSEDILLGSAPDISFGLRLTRAY